MSEVTLAILAYNEEAYIDQCLRYHKPFFDKMIVLDGDSSDSTVDIAQSHGAMVFLESEEGNFDSFADRRNCLAEKCETEWIIHIDADELFDWNFLANIDKYVAEDSKLRMSEVVAFRFPRINIDNAHPLDYHVRLYKKDECEWALKIHEVLVTKDTNERVDQSKMNGYELCQTLTGHNIIHLQRPKEDRIKQRERWRELEG